jgi:hypothetical protein
MRTCRIIAALLFIATLFGSGCEEKKPDNPHHRAPMNPLQR